MGLFSKIAAGLDKTRKNIVSGIENVFKAFKAIDDDLYDELEEALILADIGAVTSAEIIDGLRKNVKEKKLSSAEQVKAELIEIISKTLDNGAGELELSSPAVILVIGVNGVGKTTSIGKLAAYYKAQGKKIIIAAADTFRAAAIDQLEIWGERSGVPVIKHQENSDPAAVVFDAVSAAKARNADILIVDTAGRLQNKKKLMDELGKISRVIKREYSQAQVESFLVLDATTGQNALSQAKAFSEIAEVTGVIITKLDGTAKGGVIVPIQRECEVPVRFIGVGEAIDDLQPFNSTQFAKALFGAENTDETETG